VPDTLGDDLFGSKFEFINPYTVIKSVALTEIENAFSAELSKLCGEDLIVNVESIQNHKASLDLWAEMKVTVKPKQRFR